MKQSMGPCKTKLFIMYLSYAGGAIKDRVLGITQSINIRWLVGCVVAEGNDATLLKIQQTQREGWVGMDLKILIQIKPQNLETVSDRIHLKDGTKLLLIAGSGRPHCFACYEAAHLQARCL